MSANIINAARRLIKHIDQQFGDYEKSPTAKLARDLELAISAEIKTPKWDVEEWKVKNAELSQEISGGGVVIADHYGFGGDENGGPGADTKHDPYCDCGICQYCNGSEDKFGNPTRKEEVEHIRAKVLITASIECSECDDAKTENLQGGNLRTIRPEFALTAWKYGWIVEADKVLCPNCREEGS